MELAVNRLFSEIFVAKQQASAVVEAFLAGFLSHWLWRTQCFAQVKLVFNHVAEKKGLLIGHLSGEQTLGWVRNSAFFFLRLVGFLFT